VGSSGLSELSALAEPDGFDLTCRRAFGIANLLGAPIGLVGDVLGVDGRDHLPSALPEELDPLAAIVGLGRQREMGVIDRARAGVVYTPWSVACELTQLAAPVGPVCDPAMGSGVFLLATAEHQLASGLHPEAIAAGLYGADIDPVSVATARISLALWAWWRGGVRVDVRILGRNLVLADPLVERPKTWPVGGFDAVLGNPPFLGQLKNTTRRTPERTVALTERFGAPAGGYVDDVLLFTLLATELVDDGGRIMLVMPESVLGSAAGALARHAVDACTVMTHMWFGDSSTFSTAAVDVVAPVWIRRARSECDDLPVALKGRSGVIANVSPPRPGEWQTVLAAHGGVPTVVAKTSGTVSDFASVTADFRDRYYDLAQMVREGVDHQDGPLLATVGLVDPLWFRTDTNVRFAKRTFTSPRVDIGAAPSELTRRWLAERMVPKLLVATQTRVIECLPDPDGELVPSTPLLIVVANNPDDLWLLAAALCSPYLSSRAAAVAAGTGLAVGSVRLRAAQVGDLALPAVHEPWSEAAELVRSAHGQRPDPDLWARLGELMNKAYGLDDRSLITWWLGQMPRRS
jgi:hypothetical protein